MPIIPDAARLATYVGLAAPTPFVEDCATEAAYLVGGWLGDWNPIAYPPDAYAPIDLDSMGIPVAVVDRAVLEVGAELFHRKNTKNAVAQFASPDGAPVRIARDPMVAAYPLLKPYISGGFA